MSSNEYFGLNKGLLTQYKTHNFDLASFGYNDHKLEMTIDDFGLSHHRTPTIRLIESSNAILNAPSFTYSL